MTTDPLAALLQRLPADQWDWGPMRARNADIERLARRYHRTLPADYKHLLAAFGGGGLYPPNEGSPVIIYSPQGVEDLNDDPYYADGLPGMLAIGSDAGEGLYYYDPDGALGRGEYAVFVVHAGDIGEGTAFRWSYFAGANLTETIRRALSGVDFFEQEPLG